MKRDTVVKNLFWRLGERFGAKMVQFIVQMILAKMLAPEIWGTIGLILIFIEVLQVFIESGLGNALIQKKDADDLDFSTVFYFNCVICGAAYLLMFFSAPPKPAISWPLKWFREMMISASYRARPMYASLQYSPFGTGTVISSVPRSPSPMMI